MGDTSTDAQKEQVQSKCEQMQILRRMIFFSSDVHVLSMRLSIFGGPGPFFMFSFSLSIKRKPTIQCKVSNEQM